VRRLLWTALLGAALAAGCSGARFAYQNADVFLRWQATSYLDVHGAQAEALDARIAALLAWHSQKALPEYTRLAGEASKRLARGISREDLVWGYDSFQAQLREALRAAGGEVADLLDRLDAKQIAHLEQRLAEDNRKFASDYLSGSEQERRERRLKRDLARLEEWFGGLSDEQIERVRQYGARAPLTGELRDRERRRLQGEFLAMVRAREARRRLADWAANWDRNREPAYAAASRVQREEYFSMLLDLDRTLSDEQRRSAVVRLRGYAEDFQRLARQ